MRNEIICGDALAVLKTLPDEYIQCCVTSPPYFGLRDYGTAQWVGGREDCPHVHSLQGNTSQRVNRTYLQQTPEKGTCRLCGARRTDQQIGLEETPEEYIERLVEVFREVRRVLRHDGTLWINIGDSYAGSGKGPTGWNGIGTQQEKQGFHSPKVIIPEGCKPKDLYGIPWMLGFALRSDGWYLRSDIIWSKPSCMPESVTDRPTNSYEHIFLFAKSEHYYYDATAIAEPAIQAGKVVSLGEKSFSKGQARGAGVNPSGNGTADTFTVAPTRNKRNVWTINTQPYAEAHFATMPPKLVEPCVLAGSSARACEICGAPWQRILERVQFGKTESGTTYPDPDMSAFRMSGSRQAYRAAGYENPPPPKTIGWKPTCQHENQGTGKGVVLDPFMGAGTVALVATRHGRDYVGIELNPEYVILSQKRIACVQPDLWTTEGEVAV